MPARPTGTVTFLFTDIEGSTARWEHTPAAMAVAFARQEAILRAAITAHGGWAYKQIGDAFQAAFQTAPAALAAAVQAQQQLAAEPWDAPEPIKVRMAMHTGTAEERADDYVGPLLNRAARLMAAGHGGQVLLTATTYELVRDQLPAGVELRDLGERRLKDLIRPEHVYQAVVAGLPADFPPLKTLNTRPHNLPAQPNAFIGREAQIATVISHLRRPDVRLLTLTGPGGTGKTRLALQVAAALLDDYPHGVWFVDLAPLVDPALVDGSIAAVFGLQESPVRSAQEVLHDYLRPKTLLLVLDNFEQVLPAAALVATLLRQAPHLKVLVTSRGPLHIYGEQEYAVPPLALPAVQPLPPLERLTQYEAVRLFIERACAVRNDFQVTNENAPAVAEICTRLDGLPLAIELAAVRVRVFTPEALLARLDRRLGVLTGGARDLPARQRTLRATIEWSYQLLSAGERQLFRRLAVFQGERTLEAVEVVCNAGSPLAVEVLEGIEALVSHNLLGTRPEHDHPPRFWLLETIHEYARDQLAASGEEPVLRDAHLAYFLKLAEGAAPELCGPRQVDWVARLADEHDNLRAALDWAAESGQNEAGLRLAGALGLFWHSHGDFREGRARLAALLSQPAADSPASASTRGLALHWAGELAYFQGDLPAARLLLSESVSLRRAEAPVGMNPHGLAETLAFLAIIAMCEREPARAHELGQEAVQTGQRAGDKRGTAWGHLAMGEVLRMAGDLAAAHSSYQEALALVREVGDTRVIAILLMNLGAVALRRQDTRQAAAFFRQALALLAELGHKHFTASCLAIIAGTLASGSKSASAAQLSGAAETQLAAIGTILEEVDQIVVAPHLAVARAALDPAAFQAAYMVGQAMSLDDAIAFALAETADL